MALSSLKREGETDSNKERKLLQTTFKCEVCKKEQMDGKEKMKYRDGMGVI